MQIAFSISGAVLAGAGWGALGALIGRYGPAIPFFPMIGVLAIAGKADVSVAQILRAVLIVGGIGAIIGGILVYVGVAVWLATLICVLVTAAPTLVRLTKHYLRKLRRH